MALASWSTRRMVALWAGGLALQALLIVAPVLVARHLMGYRAEVLREAAERDARWRTGDLADSLSLAKQRAESRAAGTYSIAASGDTLFPLVRVPSGRPDRASAAIRHRQTSRDARYFALALFGVIPTLLILVTVGWLIGRRNAGAADMLGT